MIPEKSTTYERSAATRLPLLLVLLLTLAVSGCELVAGIFQAGFWTAIILIVVFVAIVWFVVSLFR